MKILDCTLRDGGFLNEWNFTDEFARKLFQKVIENRIDYFEIGYRMHDCAFGKFAKCKDEEIFFEPNKTKFTIMVDIKNSDINDFSPAALSPITAVRVTCHHHEVSLAIEVCEKLKQKGYEVFLNLTSILKHADFDVITNWKNKNILEAIYFADSFGELSPDDISEYFQLFRTMGFEKIGLHAHNSTKDENLALKNVERAVDEGAYIVDVSLDGNARGAGNLSFEKLQQKLKNKVLLT